MPAALGGGQIRRGEEIVLQRGSVHLCDGASADRRLVELFEHVLEGFLEGMFDEALGMGEGVGRAVGVEGTKFVAEEGGK